MKRHAQQSSRAETEIRDAPERAVKSAKRVRLGDALGDLGRKLGLTDEDVSSIDRARDTSPAEPMTVEPWRSTPMSSPRR